MADKYKRYEDAVTVGNHDYSEDLAKLDDYFDQLNSLYDNEAKQEELLQRQRLANRKAELDFRISMAEQVASLEASLEKEEQDEKRKHSEEAFKLYKADLAKRLKEEKKKKGNAFSAEDKKKILAEYAFKGKVQEKFEKEATKRAEKAEQLKGKLASKSSSFKNSAIGKLWVQQQKIASGTTGNGNDVSNGKAGLLAVVNAMSDFAKQLEGRVDSVANRKGTVDTRLQGSNNGKRAGSYWDQMSYDITGAVAMSPFVKQSAVYASLESMINSGISYNVEQRAFLNTIKDKIAGTFNAMDGTLLRLVRIQQKDSTANRLGMESALTAFLNNMYETTEYMTDMASKVRTDLAEAEALMGVSAAAEFEYQVQRWAGSMYSVGMSDSAVGSISSAIGKLAAGDVSSISDGGMGNLVVMAANRAGLSIGEKLQTGLNADETNQLMLAMVDYLAEIADESSGNKLIAQQLSKVYGISASDLKAIKNLTMDDTMDVLRKRDKYSTYEGMANRLAEMSNTLYKRTSMGEMMNNVWDNFQQTLAGGMASNPVAYLTYKAASLLDSTVGGIAIPSLSVMGNSVDLETTVADLMRVGAMSGGILSGIGAMITNLGAGGGFNGKGIIDALGKMAHQNQH